MFRGIFLAFFCLLLLGPSLSYTQDKSEIQFQLDGREPQYKQVRVSFEESFPILLDQMEGTAALIKRLDWQRAKFNLESSLKNLDDKTRVLLQQNYYRQLLQDLYQAKVAISKTMSFVDQRQKKQALRELKQAYLAVKSLTENPALNLVAAQMAMEEAGFLIGQKNYNGAGFLVQRAIEKLNQAEQNPLVSQQQVRQIKTKVFLTHQQVILLKAEDAKKIPLFKPDLVYARQHVYYNYYSFWGSQDMPWLDQ